MKRYGFIIVISILLITRIFLGVTVLPDPGRGQLIDSGGYLFLASLIAEEGNYLNEQKQDLIWPPGYPVFIFLASGFQPPNLRTIIVAQILINFAGFAVVYWIARKLFGSTVAFLATLLFSLSLNLLFWTSTFMTETLFGFLLLISFALLQLALEHESSKVILIAGFGLGLAAMVRPIGLPLVFVWAALVAFYHVQHGFKRWNLPSILLLGSALINLPWMIRNEIQRDEFVFSKVSGKTFYSFNVAEVVADIEGVDRNEATDPIGDAENPLAETLALARRYPGIFLKQQLLGILRAAFGIESGVWGKLLGYGQEGQGSFGVISSFTRGGLTAGMDQLRELWHDSGRRTHLLLGTYGIVFTMLVAVFSLVGAFSIFGMNDINRLLILILVVSAFYLIVIPGAAGQARFRIPAEPFLIILAGNGLNYTINRAIAFRKKTLPKVVGGNA